MQRPVAARGEGSRLRRAILLPAMKNRLNASLDEGQYFTQKDRRADLRLKSAKRTVFRVL